MRAALLAGLLAAALAAPARAEDEAARWRAAAERHDALAEFALGNAYDAGLGVRADAPAACEWYARAGDDGLAAGEFNSGVMQDAGRCGPRDAAAAARWYGRAAARGHARAQYAIGQLFQSGDGLPPNQREARAWFAAAAQNGLAASASAARQPVRAVGHLVAATPIYPLPPDKVTPGAGAATDVPLVWSSAELPASARFFVEVYSDGDPPATLAFNGPASRTALLAPLPPGRYAWRVLTADAGEGRYVASAWTRFQFAAAPP